MKSDQQQLSIDKVENSVLSDKTHYKISLHSIILHVILENDDIDDRNVEKVVYYCLNKECVQKYHGFFSSRCYLYLSLMKFLPLKIRNVY